MLILTRKKGQKVIIGDDIKVTVLSVSGNQVRVGFEAPSDISIHREEIYYKIRSANNAMGRQDDLLLGLQGTAVNE